MFQSTFFTFNDIPSDLMDVIACHVDMNETKRQYGINRSLISEKNINNPLPYDFGYETEVLKGDLTIAYMCCHGNGEGFDAKKLAEIAMWLYQDDYKPLISNDNPDIIYYVKFTDEHQVCLVDDDGYIKLSFVCNAPWAWTRPYVKEFDLRNYDFTENNKTFEFEMENIGNYDNFNGFEIDIELYISAENNFPDDISIRNTRNTLPENKFELTNLISGRDVVKYRLFDKENIYIHMGKRTVETDVTYISSRLYNCNKKWIKLERGKNTIEVSGKCFLTARCQYPVLI